MKKLVALALALSVVPFVAASPAGAASPQTVTVFAASSLQLQYNALAKKFMAAHPGTKIVISYGSSTTLASQIAAGAPVDIFVSADRASMAAASSEISSSTDYLVNQVVLAVPVNSSISKISDLNRAIKWIQCAHTVPCGIAADKALASEGSVTSNPVSLEQAASSTLAKLLSGAVDAAIVYKTDVVANPTKIRAIYFNDLASASTTYQIGISKSAISKKNRMASIFLSNMKSVNVLKSLAKAGFQIEGVK
jgi:molybdate transport system substrate-binding protein